MAIDTGKYLENFDLNDLFAGYTWAYLQSKGVAITDADTPNAMPVSDNKWNFGKLEENYLIKTEDNNLFLLLTCPEITSDEETITKQSVSNNLNEQFVNVIAYLIAQKHARLPAENLKLALCVNHHNAHWTMLLTQFQKLNDVEYQKLYQAYQVHARHTPPPSAVLELNHVKNFIIKNKGILFNNTSPATKENKVGASILGNNVLPIPAEKIELTHFDSLGTETNYAKLVHAGVINFVSSHNANWKFGKPTVQNGATCGDWSVYNAFQYGVLNNFTLERPSNFSSVLRLFSENITLANAHKILFNSKVLLKNIEKGTDTNKICITAAARAYANTTGDITIDPAALGDASHSNTTTISDNKKKGSFLNDLMPKLRWTGQIVLGFTAAALTYTAATSLVILATFPAVLAAAAVGLISGLFLFNPISKFFWGEFKININSLMLNQNDEIIIKGISDSKGFLNRVGLNAPYHNTLTELEKKISELLQTRVNKDMPDVERHERDVLSYHLAHQYSKELVERYEGIFYNSDKAAVNAPGYVNTKEIDDLTKKISERPKIQLPSSA